MAGKEHPNSRADDFITVSSRDIWFECPSCNKSLVVDEAGAGLIVECPQCHISVIVPPPQSPSFPAPVPVVLERPEAARVPPKPTPPPKGETLEVAALHERLGKLANQLRELQTQWTEVTNRIASRINEVNRELVVMARLDTSQKQILKEWNQIVSEIAASTQEAQPPAPTVPPLTAANRRPVPAAGRTSQS